MADRRLAEGVERRVVRRFESMPRIYQYVDPGEVAPPAQKGIDQRRPGCDLGFGRGGIAVTWHVHNVETVAAVEENEFLRAAGCARDACEVFAAGERVDQAGLADVRTACEGDFDALHAEPDLVEVDCRRV